ncbi:hypothetical protein R1sor_021758 [Riccia sorocarpa]|uniref:Uncharacterized protein n=1 Tax=Riccia sorocarpa TaxID=122646 RepID=A0ABD3GKX1_9MARC
MSVGAGGRSGTQAGATSDEQFQINLTTGEDEQCKDRQCTVLHRTGTIGDTRFYFFIFFRSFMFLSRTIILLQDFLLDRSRGKLGNELSSCGSKRRALDWPSENRLLSYHDHVWVIHVWFNHVLIPRLFDTTVVPPSIIPVPIRGPLESILISFIHHCYRRRCCRSWRSRPSLDLARDRTDKPHTVAHASKWLDHDDDANHGRILVRARIQGFGFMGKQCILDVRYVRRQFIVPVYVGIHSLYQKIFYRLRVMLEDESGVMEAIVWEAVRYFTSMIVEDFEPLHLLGDHTEIPERCIKRQWNVQIERVKSNMEFYARVQHAEVVSKKPLFLEAVSSSG